MHGTWTSRTSTSAAAAVALLAVGAVAVGAAIPDAQGTINACHPSSGVLRVVESTSQCSDGEQPLTFSQRGPTGPTGPAGTTGAAGPAGVPGPPGPRGATGLANLPRQINASYHPGTGTVRNVKVTMATLTAARGAWLVTAHLTWTARHRQGPTGGNLECQVTPGGRRALLRTTYIRKTAGFRTSYGSHSFTQRVAVGDTDSLIRLQCFSADGAPATFQNVDVTAVQVG